MLPPSIAPLLLLSAAWCPLTPPALSGAASVAVAVAVAAVGESDNAASAACMVLLTMARAGAWQSRALGTCVQVGPSERGESRGARARGKEPSLCRVSSPRLSLSARLRDARPP